MPVLPAVIAFNDLHRLYIKGFHTVGVAGSNPVAPTIELPGQKFVCFWLFCFAPSFDFFSGISLVIRGIMSCLFSFPF